MGTIKSVIIAILAIALFYFIACHKKKEKDIGGIIGTDTQIDTMNLTESQRSHLTDSMLKILNPALAESKKWKGLYFEAKANSPVGSDVVGDIQKECPDISQKVADALALYVRQNELAKQYCDSTIAQDSIAIAALQEMRSIDSTDRIKKRRLFDIAMEQQVKLTDSLRKVQPKRSVYVGGNLIGNKVDFVNGVHGFIGYRTKKGDSYQGGVMRISPLKVTQITIGYSKTIFNF